MSVWEKIAEVVLQLISVELRLSPQAVQQLISLSGDSRLSQGTKVRSNRRAECFSIETLAVPRS